MGHGFHSSVKKPEGTYKKPEGTYIDCGVKVKGRVFLTHECTVEFYRDVYLHIF